MLRSIVSVDQIEKRQIIVKLSDGTVMQFNVEELAMMFSYQVSSHDKGIERLRVHRVQ